MGFLGEKNLKKQSLPVLLIFVFLFIMANCLTPLAFAGELVNANLTGVILPDTGLLRNVPGQRVHANFQLNTNSCASCHMTHTAVGEKLLFRPGTSDACIACHDGTMGFLNVLAPAASGFGGSIAAGTFSVVSSVYNPSVHNIDSFTLVSRSTRLFDAPGGRGDGTGERGAWLPEFSCTSCHAPHGSYSIRLLQANVNQIAVRPSVDTVVYGVYGGLYQVSGVTNFTLRGGVFDASAQLWMYQLSGVPSSPWVYGYSHAHLIEEERVPQYWTRVYAPALFNPNTFDHGQYADPTEDVGEANAPYLLTRYFLINYAAGEVKQTPSQRDAFLAFAQGLGFSEAQALDLGLRIDVAQALQIRARAVPWYAGNLEAGLRQVDLIDPTSYDAPAYNLFCSACHTDYLPAITAAAQRERGFGVGIYGSRYRHSVNITISDPSKMPVRGWSGFSGPALTGYPSGKSDQLMCLSCHLAHGVDTRMMLFADGTPVSAGTGESGAPDDPWQVDLRPSSSLKRFINAAVCLTCHQYSSP